MDQMLASILESTIANYLRSVLSHDSVRQLRTGPDFEIRNPDGTRTLIEVKSSAQNVETIRRLVKQVEKVKKPSDRFILITPSSPSREQQVSFKEAFSEIPISSKWVGVQDLPDVLGTPSRGDLSSAVTAAELQIASLVDNIGRYHGAPIGSSLGASASPFEPQLAPLTRQFSHSSLSALSRDARSLEDRLRLAQRVEQVTVVLTDIVNFSSLVGASRPEDLRDSMDRYYRLAREAVFDHRGMLDKFIGDAVLAVFGYPISSEKDAISAMRFGQEMISIGKGIFPEWLEELNAVVDTGTRVGIATGDLWPINIGSTQIEITLLGDTINLAARLEKNCLPNELLIDNRTRSKGLREDSEFVSSLNLTQIQMSPSDAKGQQFPIRAWATSSAR